jgi:hypothetical protein
MPVSVDVFSLSNFNHLGLIAWAEHYLLRWYLWHAGTLPWHHVYFLEYTAKRMLPLMVGGSYILLTADYEATSLLSHSGHMLLFLQKAHPTDVDRNEYCPLL